VLEGRLDELSDTVHLAGRDHKVVRRFHLNKNIYNQKLASFNEEDNNLFTFKTLCLFQCIDINYHFKNIAIQKRVQINICGNCFANLLLNFFCFIEKIKAESTNLCFPDSL
jgi:hypothetical protein